MDHLTRIQNTTASVNTEEGAEVAVSAAQVKESISVKDDVNDAAENDIEPHNVALEAEFDALNTYTEQDEHRNHEGVDSIALVGEHSDLTT